MKIRKEKSGLHIFSRKNGFHCLFDEINFTEGEYKYVPRHLSIGLTNKCNCNCPYCYNKKDNTILNTGYILNLTKIVDKLGTLEITFGGGEPFLHPDLAYICKWIWENTSLGISITTNGFLISENIIELLKNYISFLRVSIDSLEPTYSKIKHFPLDVVLNNINKMAGKIPFGINTIIRPNNVNKLLDIIDLALVMKARNILIIPEHLEGEFILQPQDWLLLKEIIQLNKNRIEIFISYDSNKFLEIDCLETECEDEYIFAHISANKVLKKRSFDIDGIDVSSINNLEQDFYKLINN